MLHGRKRVILKITTQGCNVLDAIFMDEQHFSCGGRITRGKSIPHQIFIHDPETNYPILICRARSNEVKLYRWNTSLLSQITFENISNLVPEQGENMVIKKSDDRTLAVVPMGGKATVITEQWEE